MNPGWFMQPMDRQMRRTGVCNLQNNEIIQQIICIIVSSCNLNMQDKKPHKPMPVSEYANNLIVDMKSLSNILKSISKNLYENNNRILNELLMATQQQMYTSITDVLVHTLQIVQYKQLITHVLAILNKTIVCIKTVSNMALMPLEKQSIRVILGYIIDVLTAGCTQHRDVQETALRILQTTFSLIDHTLMPFLNQTMITKMFSILFDFCKGVSIVQNISVSALFALAESLFQFGGISQSFEILTSFLKYLFDSKKFLWIKGAEIRGLVWDLVVVAIKKFSANHIIGLQHHPECKDMISKMYQIVTENIFMKKNKDFYNAPPQNPKANHSKNSTPKQYEDITDFLRYFKAYVAISASLSIQAYRIVDKQYIPFRATIPKLIIICDLQRNSRMFIFLQAICTLLLDQYDMPLALEKGAVFMEILSKTSQQICLQNESIKVNWQSTQNYLQKIVNQQPKITDGDFVRLIKNTIINLRIKFEKDDDLLNCKKLKKNQYESDRSMTSHLPQNMGNSKKWQIFIKNVIRVVRYLSSLNFINDQSQEDPTRKLILQLQYWFLICPVSKAKNMVLQQLLITANVLNNRMQAIKVSQSVQIGSNILYGYYDDLDSTGLTIILKIMAGIKADWEEGKSFEELDEIYNLCSNIFSQQKLIKNDAAFTMTIQALVQCANSLIADIEQPKQKTVVPQNLQNNLKRSFKMIDYLIQRLIIVIHNNPAKAAAEWNFITAFFITLCFHKNAKIKQQGIKYIGLLVKNLLKCELGEQLDVKKQADILGLYLQLSKAQIKEIELTMIDQIKTVMPRIKQQSALMDGFRIVKILSDSQRATKDIIGSLHELQQILIKECLFRITDTKYLRLILDGMQIKSSEKNQQYRLINLLWSIADYFRKITPKENIPNEFLQLWENLFKSFWIICQATKQCETRQSVIHSMTQILAESCSLLPFDFIIMIISKYYHPMVLLLIGIHASSLTDAEKSPETAKVAFKNFIKIFKKLVSIENKSEQDKKQIQRNLQGINSSITKNLLKHVQTRNTGNITTQLLFQLASFINSAKDDKLFEEYGIKKDMRQMFQAIEDIIKVTEEGPQNPKIDLKIHVYTKKLKPLLDKIRQAHDKEKKQEVVAASKQEKQQTETKQTK